MAMYVYSTGGEPVGFVFETSIYGIDGTPPGRIVGCARSPLRRHVCRRVVSRHGRLRRQGRPRIIPSTSTPAAMPAMDSTFRLRAVVDYGYADAFPLLRQGADAYMSEAAE